MSVPIDVIKQVPLFKGLSDKELKTLANNFTERAFKAGQELRERVDFSQETK